MKSEEVETVRQADYWVESVRSIRRFTRRDKDARAPYKPLLLLWLIGRLAAGQAVEVSFKDAEFDLKLLMHRYRLGHGAQWVPSQCSTSERLRWQSAKSPCRHQRRWTYADVPSRHQGVAESLKATGEGGGEYEAKLGHPRRAITGTTTASTLHSYRTIRHERPYR